MKSRLYLEQLLRKSLLLLFQVLHLLLDVFDLRFVSVDLTFVVGFQVGKLLELLLPEVLVFLGFLFFPKGTSSFTDRTYGNETDQFLTVTGVGRETFQTCF